MEERQSRDKSATEESQSSSIQDELMPFLGDGGVPDPMQQFDFGGIIEPGAQYHIDVEGQGPMFMAIGTFEETEWNPKTPGVLKTQIGLFLEKFFTPKPFQLQFLVVDQSEEDDHLILTDDGVHVLKCSQSKQVLDQLFPDRESFRNCVFSVTNARLDDMTAEGDLHLEFDTDHVKFDLENQLVFDRSSMVNILDVPEVKVLLDHYKQGVLCEMSAPDSENSANELEKVIPTQTSGEEMMGKRSPVKEAEVAGIRSDPPLVVESRQILTLCSLSSLSIFGKKPVAAETQAIPQIVPMPVLPAEQAPVNLNSQAEAVDVDEAEADQDTSVDFDDFLVYSAEDILAIDRLHQANLHAAKEIEELFCTNEVDVWLSPEVSQVIEIQETFKHPEMSYLTPIKPNDDLDLAYLAKAVRRFEERLIDSAEKILDQRNLQIEDPQNPVDFNNEFKLTASKITEPEKSVEDWANLLDARELDQAESAQSKQKQPINSVIVEEDSPEVLVSSIQFYQTPENLLTCMSSRSKQSEPTLVQHVSPQASGPQLNQQAQQKHIEEFRSPTEQETIACMVDKFLAKTRSLREKPTDEVQEIFSVRGSATKEQKPPSQAEGQDSSTV